MMTDHGLGMPQPNPGGLPPPPPHVHSPCCLHIASERVCSHAPTPPGTFCHLSSPPCWLFIDWETPDPVSACLLMSRALSLIPCRVCRQPCRTGFRHRRRWCGEVGVDRQPHQSISQRRAHREVDCGVRDWAAHLMLQVDFLDPADMSCRQRCACGFETQRALSECHSPANLNLKSSRWHFKALAVKKSDPAARQLKRIEKDPAVA